MDCGVRSERSADKIVMVVHAIRPASNIFDRDRVYMMDDNYVVDLPVDYPEVAAAVPDDDHGPDALPIRRSVKDLIQISFKPESGVPDFPADPEVFVTFFECYESYELKI